MHGGQAELTAESADPLSTIAQALVRSAAPGIHSILISNGGVPITPRGALKNPPPAQSQGVCPEQNISLMKDKGAQTKTPGTEGK